MSKKEMIIKDLVNCFLYECQHVQVDGEDKCREYFANSELEDYLLIGLKQVRHLDEIPESLEDVTQEEYKVIILVAAAICERKMASDAREEVIEDWKKNLFGETLPDRIKTADWMCTKASDYENIINDWGMGK